MLVMTDESYPGPGLSFGRLDQYMYPFYKSSVLEKKEITAEFAKEILECF
jgi:formate C-acetyltransferase